MWHSAVRDIQLLPALSALTNLSPIDLEKTCSLLSSAWLEVERNTQTHFCVLNIVTQQMGAFFFPLEPE